MLLGTTLLFFFISFVIIQKAYADIANINQLGIISNIKNENTSSKLGLEPDISYYHYYLARAIEERK